MNKNISEEELAYYNSLSKADKIRYTLSHKSEQEKAEAEAKRQASRNNWTDEYRQDVCKRISTTKQNKTEEERAAQLKKFRATINSRTQEEQEEINNKIAQSIHNYFENMSEEVHKKFSKTMSDAYNNLTDEQKIARVEKGIATKKERFGEDYNPMKVQSAKDSLVKTNMEKYGVPYYCMTEACRNASGGNSANSSANLKFKDILIKNDINIIRTEFPIGNYSYDFQLDNNILIEINPFSTHNSTWGIHSDPKSKHYHYNKSKLAVDNGYRCICVWDWDDIDKIIHILTKKDSIYARNCEVRIVTKQEATTFLNANHLQGYAKDLIRIGLFYNNELVSIMTFDKPRYNNNYEWELIRYCSSKNIVGGSEKLFKYFIREYKPNSIISYCDLSKFTGDTYIKLGFKYNNTAVGCHWYNSKTHQHITDNLLRQRGFDQLFGTNYGKRTSNKELMLNAGFVEIYDSGQASYIWHQII